VLLRMWMGGFMGFQEKKGATRQTRGLPKYILQSVVIRPALGQKKRAQQLLLAGWLVGGDDMGACCSTQTPRDVPPGKAPAGAPEVTGGEEGVEKKREAAPSTVVTHRDDDEDASAVTTTAAAGEGGDADVAGGGGGGGGGGDGGGGVDANDVVLHTKGGGGEADAPADLEKFEAHTNTSGSFSLGLHRSTHSHSRGGGGGSELSVSELGGADSVLIDSPRRDGGRVVTPGGCQIGYVMDHTGVINEFLIR
jgi:hypothetical protein